eukprot:6490716-Amphidinium_carterae.2
MIVSSTETPENLPEAHSRTFRSTSLRDFINWGGDPLAGHRVKAADVKVKSTRYVLHRFELLFQHIQGTAVTSISLRQACHVLQDQGSRSGLAHVAEQIQKNAELTMGSPTGEQSIT